MANDFTINNFGGSVPRLADHLIRPDHSARALDCRLESGQLASWREPMPVQVFPPVGPPTQTIFQFDAGQSCCWVQSLGCSDFAVGGLGCGDLFVSQYRDFSGLHSRPLRFTLDEFCSTSSNCQLGVPCPVAALVATLPSSPTYDRDVEGISYTYQYQNIYGERGALSPPSDVLNADPTVGINVSGFEEPEGNWCLSDILLYRAVSGNELGREQGNTIDTTWMLVAKLPLGTTAFTDSKPNFELYEALEEDVVELPPSNLQGLVWIESMNILAGFAGHRLYFSENNSYHNWRHYLDFDDNIRGIVESNGLVYVATDGHPYVVAGEAGCEDASCRKAVRLPGPYPMVAKGNRHMAATRFGAVYPSHDGMIAIAGRSAPVVLTWAIYSPRDWQRMEPHTALPMEHGGKLFVFLANGAFAMSTPQSSEQGWDNDSHTELSDRGVKQVVKDRQGNMYLLKDDALYQWDRGASLRPHSWKSREFVTPVAFTFGAAHIHFNGAAENVTITVDGREVLNRPVAASRPFRLPMWSHGARWQFTLDGTATVSLFSMAPSMYDLGS